MIKTFLATAATLLVATAAMAHDNHDDAWTDQETVSQPGAMPVTRAEVLADLDVYRRSGLADLDSHDSVDVYGAEYLKAQARYRALRASPNFAMLVSRIAHERGEAVTTASVASSAVSR